MTITLSISLFITINNQVLIVEIFVNETDIQWFNQILPETFACFSFLNH